MSLTLFADRRAAFSRSTGKGEDGEAVNEGGLPADPQLISSLRRSVLGMFPKTFRFERRGPGLPPGHPGLPFAVVKKPSPKKITPPE
ncbi:MAG TPA: hypothetical protein VEN78_04070 [Bradyrhizobium sp.]|nr:hypothetical protein [Bradyrhizobium sp.]